MEAAVTFDVHRLICLSADDDGALAFAFGFTADLTCCLAHVDLLS
jgi:hypothetical protein